MFDDHLRRALADVAWGAGYTVQQYLNALNADPQAVAERFLHALDPEYMGLLGLEPISG